MDENKVEVLRRYRVSTKENTNNQRPSNYDNQVHDEKAFDMARDWQERVTIYDLLKKQQWAKSRPSILREWMHDA